MKVHGIEMREGYEERKTVMYRDDPNDKWKELHPNIYKYRVKHERKQEIKLHSLLMIVGFIFGILIEYFV